MCHVLCGSKNCHLCFVTLKECDMWCAVSTEMWFVKYFKWSTGEVTSKIVIGEMRFRKVVMCDAISKNCDQEGDRECDQELWL